MLRRILEPPPAPEGLAEQLAIILRDQATYVG